MLLWFEPVVLGLLLLWGYTPKAVMGRVRDNREAAEFASRDGGPKNKLQDTTQTGFRA